MQNEATLITLRKKIDAIDGELLALFKARMEAAALVAAYKKETGTDILQSGREEEILQRVQSEAGEALSPYARELFETLMRLSRRYQNELFRSGEC